MERCSKESIGRRGRKFSQQKVEWWQSHFPLWDEIYQVGYYLIGAVYAILGWLTEDCIPGRAKGVIKSQFGAVRLSISDSIWGLLPCFYQFPPFNEMLRLTEMWWKELALLPAITLKFSKLLLNLSVAFIGCYIRFTYFKSVILFIPFLMLWF